VIPREAQGARQAVLNLASIFRYFLRHGESTIALREEIGLVRAYLEIEQLRLGPKLRTEFEIDAAALDLRVPVLSLEPLAENAVRHGVAKLAEGGLVRVEAAWRMANWSSRSPTPGRASRRTPLRGWAWRMCAAVWRSGPAPPPRLS
jgi:LytS/YehU family sensor histidine kinase